MNGYQRIVTALKNEKPDRIPTYELIIDRPVIEGLYGDISPLDFVEKEDLDGISVLENSDMRSIEKNTYIDEWQIVWKKQPNEILFPVDGPIKSYKDLKEFIVPDPDAEYKYKNLKDAVTRFKGNKAIIFIANETFEWSCYLSGGIDKLLINYILDPDFVLELSEKIWWHKERLIKNAVEAGADIIVFGDDYANKDSLLMSPDHFRKFVLPYLDRAIKTAKQENVYVIKHSDGNLWKVIEEIINTGIDGINPIEPMAKMDIGEVKTKYGDKVCVIGNIDCSMLLPMGTTDDVEEAVKETIAKAAPGGGYIMASSNSIHSSVNPQNYKAMLKALHKYGEYPIDKKLIEEYKNKNYIKKFI